MDVGEWLRSLGLGQYAGLFRENGIDADAEVLPEVTEFDLEKFGVPFGHRERILKAIAGLGSFTSTSPVPALPQNRPQQPTPSPEAAAERRHSTVMLRKLVAVRRYDGLNGLVAD